MASGHRVVVHLRFATRTETLQLADASPFEIEVLLEAAAAIEGSYAVHRALVLLGRIPPCDPAVCPCGVHPQPALGSRVFYPTEITDDDICITLVCTDADDEAGLSEEPGDCYIDPADEQRWRTAVEECMGDLRRVPDDYRALLCRPRACE